jgi:hypothetical protein
MYSLRPKLLFVWTCSKLVHGTNDLPNNSFGNKIFGNGLDVVMNRDHIGVQMNELIDCTDSQLIWHWNI